MFPFLKRLFGGGTDFKALNQRGAQIIDVRTKGEFQGGHIQGAINIPLQELAQNISRIRKEKPIITCCASGMRSATAKSILTSKGFPEVYNGGGWMRLNQKLN